MSAEAHCLRPTRARVTLTASQDLADHGIN